MKNTLLFVALLMSGGLSAQGTQFSRAWSMWCEFSNNNFEQTSDGGYIVCTDAVPEMDTLTINPCSYGYLIKLDSLGGLEWMKKFQKADSEIKPLDGNAVIQTYDGGYAIATCYYTHDSVTSQYRNYTYVIRTDALGNAIWSNVYPGIGSSQALCIIEAENHDLVVCGATVDSSNASIHGNFLMRTNSSGTQLWAKAYGYGTSINSGEFSSVKETASGDLLVCGSSVIQALIIRTDANGNIIWSRRNPCDMNSDIDERPNGNIVSVGYTNNFNYTTYFELDSFGNSLHSCYYNSSPYRGSSIVPTWDGATIVGEGYTSGTLLMHITDSGSVLWNRTYSDADGMLRPDLERTADGGYAFAAQSLYNPAVPFDWATVIIKTDSIGEALCNDSTVAFVRYPYSSPTNTTLNTITANGSFAMSTVMIPVSLKDSNLCVSTAIHEFTRSEANVLLYPNPASNVLSVDLANLEGSRLVISLCNAQGQSVLVETHSVSGTYSGILDLRTLPAGLYFIEFGNETGSFARRKFIRE